MNVKTAPVQSLACAPGALAGGPARTRFFDGMFLTQGDLENEQRYWRIKRRLTNRALGEGVVWGLRLTWNQAKRTFTLSPGYAIDCCGNDLVVECPIEISERQLWELADPALRAAIQPGDAFRMRGALAACVALQYVECAEDARPVHRDACSGPTAQCEPSRVRETARLLLVPPRSPSPKSPPELFLDELAAFRNALPAECAPLFPPAPQPTPAPPSTGVVPVSVVVTVPDSPDATGTAQPELGQPVTIPTLSAHQTPAASRPSGVVTFEMRPSSGWGFTAGVVRDGARVVERVSPPIAMSMYWSLDVALPASGQSETMQFEFSVESLALEEMFASHRIGNATFTIAGTVQVKGAAAGATGVDVTVSGLVITTKSADVVEGGARTSCFGDAVPWGWATEPTEGPAVAKVLVLSALYATLSEAIARGASPAWRQLAYLLYRAAWLAFFGANLTAPAADACRQKLVGLILELYQRWCAGLLYPGPRCTDEHHGVYLGCGTLAPNGGFASFDMWSGRRQVLTGPLFTHWAGQFGIAPVDVIVGRFADAICCLAGQPAIAIPARGVVVGVAPSAAVSSVDLANRVVVGDAAGLAAAARTKGASLRWVAGEELMLRALQLFARADLTGPTELVATQLAGGGSVAIVAPASTAAAAPSQIRTDVASALRTGPARVASAARAPLTELAVAIAYAAPASSLVAPGAAPAVAALAKQLDDHTITVGRLVDGGADAALAAVGVAPGDRATSDAAHALVDAGEQSIDQSTAALSRAAAPGLGAGVANPAFLARATPDVTKAFGGRLASSVVAAAATSVAGR